MVRRTSPQKRTDEIVFPVRVKFRVPPTVLGGVVGEVHAWLHEELGPGRYATHADTTIGGSAVAFYFVDTKDAHAFIATFPALTLADGTQFPAYYTPAKLETWSSEDLLGMCNLYSLTKGQAAIRAWFDSIKDQTGNLAPQTGIYPDYHAPVVANTEAGLVLQMMRWGMPSPRFAL